MNKKWKVKLVSQYGHSEYLDQIRYIVSDTMSFHLEHVITIGTNEESLVLHTSYTLQE